MKWRKLYYLQVQECKRTGNRFKIDASDFNQYAVIVCIPFKTFCHSAACFEKRKEEGKE